MNDVLEAFSRYFEVIPVDSDELRKAVFNLRYQVYCVETRFEDESAFPDQLEKDSYDDGSDHILLRHRATGWWAGTARLVLPTHNPNDLYPVESSCGDVFSAELRGPIELPRTTSGEASRFAVSKEFRRRHQEYLSPSGVGENPDYDRRDYHNPVDNDNYSIAQRQDSGRRTQDEERKVVPHIALGLLQGLIGMSVKHDVTHWAAAMEPALLRLFTRLGIYFQGVGPVIEYHGKRQPCVAQLDNLLSTAKRQRPDVWSVLSDGGRLVPKSPY